MNTPNKNEHRGQSNGYQRGRGRVKWVKKTSHVITDGNSVFHGEHTVGYTEIEI